MIQKTGALFIKEKLKNISHSSGVYRMLDKYGTVLYVGKAKDLAKRLTNYTHPEKLSTRIAQMVQHTTDLMIIETAGETEAFLLENDLIKQFRPYYNILLKDDKSFPSILLTHEDIPRVMKYRGNRTIKGDYFGPYASGEAITHSIAELQKIFGLRVCNNTYFKNRARPCLLYQIHKCSGPCTGQISPTEYRSSVQEAKAFLKGDTQTIQEKMRQKMLDYAQHENFEQAALIRDKILFLNKIQDTSSQTPLFQTDIIALYRQNDTACVTVFFYRNGQSNGNTTHFLSDLDDTLSNSDILGTFLMQFYDKITPPKTIYLSEKINVSVTEALKKQYQTPLQILCTAKGFRKKLMEQALLNARQNYITHTLEQKTSDAVWFDLQSFLHLKQLNKVEIYDNSHIQGASAVGAMVVTTKDGFQKNLYRRFNIDATQTKTNDDFGMMKQVLHRRLTRGLAENDLPDALIIDGGKGQLSAVLSILSALNITTLTVLAVAKGEHRNAGKETFFVSEQPNTPVYLDFKSPLIHLLQRLRDEAHRFAIGSHRIKRAKNMFHETLFDIDGIGQKRKKELLIHFGSPREIAGASVEQLMRVKGINQKIAKKIYTFYHGLV